MIVSDSRRFLFVHVQKTGGSSIDRTLREVLPDVRCAARAGRHASLAKILRTEPGLVDYWTVGFVRNPWSRMLSWHRMVDRFRDGAANGSRSYRRLLANNAFLNAAAKDYPDFESFVMHGTDRFPQLQAPQLRYLSTRTRRADFIGRQETFDADLRAICARLSIPPVEPTQINIDPDRPDYRDAYTPAMKQKVADIFQRDIEAFGYHF